ncbi:MAG: ribosomal protein S18 acetylase RimI-like enzyme [Sphingobacteriales bacterium]|jgi:ribosomal protein S18 acetylase RimI-like enzyme
MLIRDAQPSDLKQLSVLFDNYRQFYLKSSDIAAAESFLKERLEKKDSHILVADNGDLIGFTQIYPLLSSIRMKPLWLLNDLFVDEAVRGQKVGEKLMLGASEMAKSAGACGLMLETGISNIVGQKLYEKLGYKKAINEFHYSLDF